MTVVLDNRMEAAVVGLLMAEPEAGALLPSTALESFGRLIRCDGYGVGESDSAGYCFRLVSFPHLELDDPRVCDGPVPTGLIHDASQPSDLRGAADEGLRDQLRLGFSTHSGTVSQLYFARKLRYFSGNDIAVLAMLAPVIGRLARACVDTAASAGTLSASERRVLALVARGASNREVAEELYVTVHTVRKHLENAYRKLGVTNRTAAARLLVTSS